MDAALLHTLATVSTIPPSDAMGAASGVGGDGLPWSALTLRLVVASVLGAAIGFDREARGRHAGLRTHMLVALGSAAFALLALEARGVFPSDDALRVDPLRIVSAIVGGIGFLGAGAILHARGGVRGLTTAAGLWVTAAIGIAAGFGLYLLALLATAISAITITGLRFVEHHAVPDAEDQSST